MIGRLLGLLAGAAIAALGYGLWKPVAFAKFVDPKYLDLAHVELGPFAPYKTVLAFMTMALGLARVIPTDSEFSVIEARPI